MTDPATPLPKPTPYLEPKHYAYTADQLRAYGDARAAAGPLTDAQIDAITRDKFGTRLLGVAMAMHREFARAILAAAIRK